jgi:hypothetical protein
MLLSECLAVDRERGQRNDYDPDNMLPLSNRSVLRSAWPRRQAAAPDVFKRRL